MSSPDITKKAIEKMSAEEVVKYLNARKNWHGRRYREVCGWWLSVQNTQPPTARPMKPPQPAQSYRYFKDDDDARWKMPCDGSGGFLMENGAWRSSIIGLRDILESIRDEGRTIETDESGTPLAPVAQDNYPHGYVSVPRDLLNRLAEDAFPQRDSSPVREDWLQVDSLLIASKPNWGQQPTPPESRPCEWDAAAAAREVVYLAKLILAHKEATTHPHPMLCETLMWGAASRAIAEYEAKGWPVREVTGGGWRDIISVPLDGTPVLLWAAICPDESDYRFTQIVAYWNGAAWEVDGQPDFAVYTPTKWQPLPQPPTP